MIDSELLKAHADIYVHAIFECEQEQVTYWTMYLLRELGKDYFRGRRNLEKIHQDLEQYLKVMPKKQ